MKFDYNLIVPYIKIFLLFLSIETFFYLLKIKKYIIRTTEYKNNFLDNIGEYNRIRKIINFLILSNVIIIINFINNVIEIVK